MQVGLLERQTRAGLQFVGGKARDAFRSL
jgi:hypothetical protein